MSRRVLGSIVAAILALTATACSSSSSGGGGTPSGGSSATSGAPSTSPTSSTSASGPILVGVVVPLTGAEATPGQFMLDGLKAGVSYINNNGGILGRQIKLLVEDSAGSPVQAVAKFKLLQAKHIQVIFGDLLAGYSAMVPLFKPANIISIDQNTTDSTWTPVTNNPNGFNIFIPTSGYAQIFVNYLIKNFHVKKIGVIGGTDDFGVSLTADVKSYAQSHGVQVVTQQFPANATSLVTQMRALKNAGADGLVSATFAGDQILSIQAQQALGWDPPEVTSNTLNDSAGVAAVKAAGLKNIAGGVVSSFMLQSHAGAPETQHQKIFLSYLQKAVGKGTSLDGVWSTGITWFDGILVWKSAVEKAGTTATAAVKKVMESGTPLAGWSGNFEYSPTSHIPKNVTSIFGLYQGGVDCPGPCPAAKG
jgi:ABC-type branched-subunit amino acid transport system substrate-binding protein